MKYLCLGYRDPAKMDARPKAEIDQVMSRCQPYMDELYKGGHVIVDAGLALETTVVRTVNGKLSVTDGPFIETKEQLGGVLLIEARDLNQAIVVASRDPAAQMGEEFGWGLEIRPVTGFHQG